MKRGHWVLALLFILAALLVSPIDRQFQREAEAAPGTQEGALERILGSSKEIIGDAMFLKADEYFHGGVIEKFHETPDVANRGGVVEEAEERGPEKPADWIAAVNARVQSHEHAHLSGEKRQEMLPFFAISTTLDPHNIEAILATAFWLDGDFGKTGDAVKVLEKGIVDNPRAWQLPDQLAGIYFNRLKDYAQSRHYYLEALKTARGQKLEGYEWIEIHYYLAESYFHQSQKRDALFHYRRALSYLNGRGIELEKTVRKKIASLG